MDARLSVALTNAKRTKALRVKKWLELRKSAEPVVFELRGYLTKRYKKAWCAIEAAKFVRQVFGSTGPLIAPYQRSFVCHRFILETAGCWEESGFRVVLMETGDARSRRLLKNEVHVMATVTLQDASKPFAASKKAEAEQANAITRRLEGEKETLSRAISRIQAAILQESESLAFAGITAIEMPSLFQLREIPYHYGGGPTERQLVRLQSTTMFQGLPSEPVSSRREMNDGRAHFLPLDEEFMQTHPVIGALWKAIE
jgi:hypothetical protein